MSLAEATEVHQTTQAERRATAGGVEMAGVGEWKFWAGLLILGVIGASFVILAAQARMGMNTDGTAYYGTARRVIAGQGPLWPYGFHEQELRWTVHFPPLFGLAAGHLSTIGGVSDPQITVRYLHGALLGVTLVLTGWMVRRYTGSGWWGLGAAIFLVVTADVLDAYASFMSEPLYIVLGLAGLVAVDTGARRRGLLGAVSMVFLGGCLIGAACWCRYAGISLVAAAGAGLLFYPRLRWGRRLALAAAAFVPMAVGWWTLSEYVFSVTQAATSRCVRFQPNQLVHLTAMVWMPFQWVLPYTTKALEMAIAAGGCACGAVMIVRGLRREQEVETFESVEMEPAEAVVEKAPPAPWVFLWGSALYGGLLAFSAVCVDPAAAPLEPRLLVPWLPMLTVVAAWALRRRMGVSGRPELARMGLGMMITAIAIGNSPRYIERFRGDEQRLIGYTSQRWAESGTAQWVRDHVPADALIFCNRCDALYYLTHRNSVWVPKSREKGKARAAFAAEVARMCQEMGAKQGFLVCFDETWAESFGVASSRELAEKVVGGLLTAEAVTNDGIIYRWTPWGEPDRGSWPEN